MNPIHTKSPIPKILGTRNHRPPNLVKEATSPVFNPPTCKVSPISKEPTVKPFDTTNLNPNACKNHPTMPTMSESITHTPLNSSTPSNKLELELEVTKKELEAKTKELKAKTEELEMTKKKLETKTKQPNLISPPPPPPPPPSPYRQTCKRPTSSTQTSPKQRLDRRQSEDREKFLEELKRAFKLRRTQSCIESRPLNSPIPDVRNRKLDASPDQNSHSQTNGKTHEETAPPKQLSSKQGSLTHNRICVPKVRTLFSPNSHSQTNGETHEETAPLKKPSSTQDCLTHNSISVAQVRTLFSPNSHSQTNGETHEETAPLKKPSSTQDCLTHNSISVAQVRTLFSPNSHSKTNGETHEETALPQEPSFTQENTSCNQIQLKSTQKTLAPNKVEATVHFSQACLDQLTHVNPSNADETRNIKPASHSKPKLFVQKKHVGPGKNGPEAHTFKPTLDSIQNGNKVSQNGRPTEPDPRFQELLAKRKAAVDRDPSSVQ